MPRIEPIPWEKLSDKQKHYIESGMASGGFTNPVPLQILAYADHDSVPDDHDRHPNFPNHLLNGRLLELLRIRSAQLGGCEPCMASRKVDNVDDTTASCLYNPTGNENFSNREKLALEFLERLATDHHSIDEQFYRHLAEIFTTAEIVELGLTAARMVGTHRFMHTLDAIGDSAPVIYYDESQVGVTWSEWAASK